MTVEEEKWECDKCGACCEVIYPKFFGKDCELYDKETKTCKDYENRPEMCRTNLLLRGDKFYINACNELKQEQQKLSEVK